MKEYTIEHMEQAALFALNIDRERISERAMDKVGGMSGIYSMLAEQSVCFVSHHIDLARDNYDDLSLYWDAEDWYVLSDEWFGEHIAPALYE